LFVFSFLFITYSEWSCKAAGKNSDKAHSLSY